VALAVAAVCGVAGWIASELLTVSLFGEGVAGVPSLIGILLLGIVPFSVAKVIGNYLAGSNAVALNAVATIPTLIVAVALALLLIPGYGATGAAWATVVAYWLQTLLLIALFARKTAVPFSAVVRLRSYRSAAERRA
jgi:Na+-driven multidrug efflux pump